ncbi:hypothetical protein BDQ17DRAFT_1373122 [Cyathus striatus]|nr:hypothetical protein BDQ17DRAFT_1373122 [Cyathus striatus]
MAARQFPGMTGNAMPPSRSRFTLDLNDIIDFPDIGHIPVMPPHDGESWFILTEITQNQSLNRPAFLVEDKRPGNFWTVAFYTDNPWVDAKDCRPGTMICIKNGMPTRFMDGRYGYRIEDPEDIIVLPCSMARLREINESLRQRYMDGLLLTCVACNQPVKMGCGKCKTRYCSRDCQRQDWPTHKPICKIVKTLHGWNRTDWC